MGALGWLSPQGFNRFLQRQTSKLKAFALYSRLQQDFRNWLSDQIQCGYDENIRPDWLITDTGERCELDFYVESMRLAIEIQGDQHYRFTPHFHSTYEVFQAQRRRDRFKLAVCQKRGIKLILVHNRDEFQAVGEHIWQFQTLLRIRSGADIFRELEITAKRFCNRWRKHTASIAKLETAKTETARPEAIEEINSKISKRENALRQLLTAYQPQIQKAINQCSPKRSIGEAMKVAGF